jgi:C4-dicarboxylate-specific signal transduction histidine kinase
MHRSSPFQLDLLLAMRYRCLALIHKIQYLSTSKRRKGAVILKREKKSSVTHGFHQPPFQPQSLWGALVPGVAHELNNPLSVIIGFAQSLLRSTPPQTPAATSLQLIEQEALRCQRLIQDLRALAREPKSEKTAEDVKLLVEGIIPLLKAQAKLSRTEVAMERSDDVPPIRVNRLQLQWGILSLCLNMLGEMTQGGTLVLGVKLLKETGELEIFLQATGRRAPPPSSLGQAGMTFVQDIATAHGGAVQTAETTLGKNVSLRLPLRLT